MLPTRDMICTQLIHSSSLIAMEYLPQNGLLCLLPRLLSRGAPGNAVLVGLSGGATLCFEVSNLTESATSPLRGVVELDYRTPDVAPPALGFFFALEIPRVRFHSKSIHYIAGLDNPLIQVSDEAVAPRRALYSCPDAVYRLDATAKHTFVCTTHYWDIARQLRSLLCSNA